MDSELSGTMWQHKTSVAWSAIPSTARLWRPLRLRNIAWQSYTQRLRLLLSIGMPIKAVVVVVVLFSTHLCKHEFICCNEWGNIWENQLKQRCSNLNWHIEYAIQFDKILMNSEVISLFRWNSFYWIYVLHRHKKPNWNHVRLWIKTCTEKNIMHASLRNRSRTTSKTRHNQSEYLLKRINHIECNNNNRSKKLVKSRQM